MEYEINDYVYAVLDDTGVFAAFIDIIDIETDQTILTLEFPLASDFSESFSIQSSIAKNAFNNKYDEIKGLKILNDVRDFISTNFSR